MISSLAKYIKLSPNCSKPRKNNIDTISIHVFDGNLPIERMISIGRFTVYSTKNASCNYCIDSQGKIGCVVDEDNRSWCTSSKSNDNRAITIEVANDGGSNTGYHVTDEAINSLVDLIVDICKRHNIKKMLWRNDKTLIGKVKLQNMTVHRWFAPKSCPGPYLLSKHTEIARRVNERLGLKNTDPTVGYEEGENEKTADSSFQVKVEVRDLRIRNKPGTKNSKIVGIIKPGVYTITKTAVAPGANLWGKLKSGAGYIALDYTKRI